MRLHRCATARHPRIGEAQRPPPAAPTSSHTPTSLHCPLCPILSNACLDLGQAAGASSGRKQRAQAGLSEHLAYRPHRPAPAPTALASSALVNTRPKGTEQQGIQLCAACAQAMGMLQSWQCRGGTWAHGGSLLHRCQASCMLQDSQPIPHPYCRRNQHHHRHRHRHRHRQKQQWKRHQQKAADAAVAADAGTQQKQQSSRSSRAAEAAEQQKQQSMRLTCACT
jgi:hypothetical protein